MISLKNQLERQSTRRRGFSLVEILATVVILGAMAVSTLQMYSFGTRTNGIVEEELMADNLLQYKVEEAKCKPFAKNLTAVAQVVAPYTKYSFDITQNIPYLGNLYLKKVTVTCKYTSLLGMSKMKTIVFLVANTL